LTALTQEQLELLRRAHDGASLAQFPLVPHPLEELGLLKRVDLLEVDLDGNVRLTERGIECLAASTKEILDSGGTKTDG
jgi:hypothetical protein